MAVCFRCHTYDHKETNERHFQLLRPWYSNLSGAVSVQVPQDSRTASQAERADRLVKNSIKEPRWKPSKLKHPKPLQPLSLWVFLSSLWIRDLGFGA